MTSIFKLFLLVAQAHCLTDYGRLQSMYDHDNNVDHDSDYELPEYWRHLRPTKAQINKVPNIRANPTIKKNFPTPKSTKPKTSTKKITITWKRFHDFSQSYFQALESYEVQSIPIPEDKYPWIAKVVHSRSQDYPYVCTAACIEKRIFITAGRCIASLKVASTSVIYQKRRFLVKVFVIPDSPTKQMFDDVGIIVVYDSRYSGMWPTVQLFNGKRKDNHFQWFADLNYTDKAIDHKVIGYATKKFVHRLKEADTEFRLTELNVIVDINMCDEILSRGGKNPGYFVPCYHSCGLEDFENRAPNCQPYHGTEGGAVYNFKTNKLLGLATWGCNSASFELPVGFTVPNSNSFYKDLACARKIRQDRNDRPHKGYYQGLCNRNTLL